MKNYEESMRYDLIVGTISVLLMAFLFFMNPNNALYLNRNTNNLEDFSKAWYTEDEKSINLEDVGELAELNSEGVYEIDVYHIIPAYLSKDISLNFRTKHIRFKAMIGNRVVKDFMPYSKYSMVDGNGRAFHSIVLRASDAGKTLKLKVYPAYHDSSPSITNIYLGRETDYIGKIVDESFFNFICCIIVIILGVFMIVISFAEMVEGRQSIKHRTLGILAIFIGTWAMFETSIIQLFFGFSQQLHEINYILLIFIPYLFVSYAFHSQDGIRLRTVVISFSVVMFELVTVILLKIFFKKDVHDTLMIIHLGFATNAIILIASMIRSLIYCKKNNIKSKAMPIIITILLFTVCGIGDLIRYYLGIANNDNGIYIRIGMFISTFILSYDSVKKLFYELKKVEVSDIMKKMAYTDALTGMSNRLAFEEKEKELSKKISSGEISEVLICQFDLNNLKKVNDNYGHAMGDIYIKKCGELIDQVFGINGFTFRVGGDEFMVFILGERSEYIYEKGILKLRQLEREYNKESETPIPLEIAFGSAVYSKERFETIEKAEMEADKKMYKQKEAMKRGELD